MKTTRIPYADESTELEGFAAFPETGKHPLAILCHAWRGRDPFICEKAENLTRLGLVGFALDVYGKGVLGQSREENSTLKEQFLKDRHLLLRRLMKGVETAKSLPSVDISRIAVIGFGFGGLCALDLARSGVSLKGVVSLYGHYDPPPFPAKPIQAKVLLLHGYNDPISTLGSLHAFEKELEAEKIDWQSHVYGNAMHSFTTPGANLPEEGILYNPVAAKRGWHAVELFCQEVLSD